jgi:hypothetical protein
MLIDAWQVFVSWIVQFGMVGIIIILIIAFFHPTFEAPAAILLLTILSILLGSPWLASIFLLASFSAGFSLFYLLVHLFHRKSGFWLNRFHLSAKALRWVKAQPTWKHILIIGMPLVYTYPLRVAFTINHKNFWPYFFQTLGQYLVLTVGNLLMYFGIIEIIFLNLPWWVITVILAGIAILIYSIKQRPIII